MANYSSPSCPADCGSLTLPSYSISTCDDNYTLESSEIQFLYLAAQSEDVDGNPVPVAKPTDWTSAADWAAVLETNLQRKIKKLRFQDSEIKSKHERTH